MKKILLDANKPYFKANLHSHSDISDGQLTPEEMKQAYMEHGYSVIAYTDHDVLIGHNDLTDDNFLALNGYEIEVSEEGKPWGDTRSCHLCLIALEPDNLNQVCVHRTEYLLGNGAKYIEKVQFDRSKPDYVRVYSPECINEIIAEGRKNGFFVTYNHPGWSLETLRDYGEYKGMNAMEICNYGSVHEGYVDRNERPYDEFLRDGKRIFCSAGDDNHSRGGKDSFGGFVMINADKLEYRTITKALEEGKFYASEGPEIYGVYFEDGVLSVECSDAAQIRFNTGIRRTGVEYWDGEAPLNSASFKIWEGDHYIRITVTDRFGKCAYTSAYFTDDLLSE